jgi:hypothetical protein
MIHYLSAIYSKIYDGTRMLSSINRKNPEKNGLQYNTAQFYLVEYLSKSLIFE